jgi:phosphoribosyl-dephospho-CoA transferase
LSVAAQLTWKKSQASIVEAWVRRNWRQVVSVSLIGAGGIRNRRRTRRIVDAPTR